MAKLHGDFGDLDEGPIIESCVEATFCPFCGSRLDDGNHPEDDEGVTTCMIMQGEKN